jgi:hypothetical protein
MRASICVSSDVVYLQLTLIKKTTPRKKKNTLGNTMAFFVLAGALDDPLFAKVCA